MNFKPGSLVKVIIEADKSWPFWMPEMYEMVGKICRIKNLRQIGPDGILYPTIIIPGGTRGCTGTDEYAFPEHCLRLVDQQLLFEFMYE